MGGYDSEAFLRERCGVGNYPEDEEVWRVISKPTWGAAADPLSTIVSDRKVLAIAGDPERGTSVLCLAARRPDGVAHLEVMERHRGTAWLAPRIDEVIAGLRKTAGEDNWTLADDGQPVIILSGDVTAHVAGLLDEAQIGYEKVTVEQYATGCQSLIEQVRTRQALHTGEQASLNKSVATAEQVTGGQGRWTWKLDTAQDSGPVRGITLALLGLDRFVPKEDKVGDVW